MMLKKIAAVSLVVFIMNLIPDAAYPELKDFKNDVEREESLKKSKEDNGQKSSSTSRSTSVDNSDDEACGEIFYLGFVLWWYENISAWYLDYPYKENVLNKNYIVIEELFDDLNDRKRIDTELQKPYYYKLESGKQWCGDDGSGYFIALSGKFYKIIGPEIEARRITDGYDTLDSYALGVNIALFHAPGIITDLYIQKIYFSGLLERDGAAFGGIVNIYPFRPVIITARYGIQQYDKIRFKDYGCRIGFIYNRYEFFAGYRKIESEYARLKGPEAGVRVYF